MNKLKNIFLVLAVMVGFAISCKDEDLVLVPTWETAIHGNGEVAETSSPYFIRGQMNLPVDVNLSWISIDNKNTVSKIDVYVLFNETYIDPTGIPATAKHGGNEGVLLATYEGGDVPGNRQAKAISLMQEDLYDLYANATFDYDKDANTAETPVFNNPAKPGRSATSRFLDGDAFQLRWEFTTADGRVFDSWSPSVCNEFPDASCSINWAVICAPDFVNPGLNGGLFQLVMHDTYGDGWNGGALRVIIDGVATDYTMDNGSDLTVDVQVAADADLIEFEYISGDWDSEVIFQIISPKGNTIADYGPSPPVGPITLNLCNE